MNSKLLDINDDEFNQKYVFLTDLFSVSILRLNKWFEERRIVNGSNRQVIFVYEKSVVDRLKDPTLTVNVVKLQQEIIATRRVIRETLNTNMFKRLQPVMIDEQALEIFKKEKSAPPEPRQ